MTGRSSDHEFEVVGREEVSNRVPIKSGDSSCRSEFNETESSLFSVAVAEIEEIP